MTAFFSLMFGVVSTVLLFGTLVASSKKDSGLSVDITKEVDIGEYRLQQAESCSFLYRERNFSVEPGCGLAHLVAKLDEQDALYGKKK